MTVFVQLADGTRLQFTPPPERLLSSLLGGAPFMFPLYGSASGTGVANDAMLRAMHELFARSQSEQHGPPPTSKAFLDALPLRTWDAAACAGEKYTDCPICLSEFETADKVLALPAEPEQEPAFEQMLRSLLGVRRERSPACGRHHADADDEEALDSMLEEEASRFVEEETTKKQSDAAASDTVDSDDVAMFDDVDLEELLRDAGASASSPASASATAEA
ncbi:hypothetical protein PybrP1_002752 [[Pythium] brassicae (nom. inval.)]|nr:hypothetical protein PybrP1_002752 [[Pythium] brassicae (nom. inval.)]